MWDLRVKEGGWTGLMGSLKRSLSKKTLARLVGIHLVVHTRSNISGTGSGAAGPNTRDWLRNIWMLSSLRFLGE